MPKNNAHQLDEAVEELLQFADEFKALADRAEERTAPAFMVVNKFFPHLNSVASGIVDFMGSEDYYHKATELQQLFKMYQRAASEVQSNDSSS